MTETEVVSLVLEIAGCAGAPALAPSTSLADLGLDSFGLLELLTVLEGQATGPVPDDPPPLRTLRDVLDHHARLVERGGRAP